MSVCKKVVIETITPHIDHAEGPHWDPEENRLYYVNTFQPEVLCWDYNSKKTTKNTLEGTNSIGYIIPIKGLKFQFLVTADRNIYKLKWDPKQSGEGPYQKLHEIESDKPNNQFNEGKCDIQGTLWSGTLNRNADLTVVDNGGSLYKIFGDEHSMDVEEIIANTSISNGMAWNMENTKFYYIDSDLRNVRGYDFNATDGEISNEETVFDMENYPELEGIPDGMTADTSGNLWIALHGGRGVINVDPKTGKLLQFIDLGVTYPTSCVFGGPNFQDLFVTTSRNKLRNYSEKLMKEPNAGSVFRISNLGVRGFQANEYNLFNNLL